MTRLRWMKLTAVSLIAAVLVACAGLPTGGGVNAGLAPGEVDSGTDVTFFPSGPVAGGSPEVIIQGFIEAATSPAGNWAIAKQFFLTERAADAWHPEASVTLDRSWVGREMITEISAGDHWASVQVELTPVATVDDVGAYTLSPGGVALVPPYELSRNDEGEWRLVSAPDGIIMDADSFAQVFQRYSMKFFDQHWDHLVPDPRWFPRREGIVTTITRTVINGEASAWLAHAVNSAFPASVNLGRDSVPVDPEDHIAEVELTPSALALDGLTLARMRTQLEQSLIGTGVSAVRFTVDGREIEAERVETVANRIDSSTLVLTEEAFGSVIGDQVTPLAGVSEAIMQIAEPIRAIDVSGDGESALVTLADDGGVLRVIGGTAALWDDRAGLIAPGLDADGYAWSVPADAPQELWAWASDAVSVPIEGAWPDASEISQLRISPDGVRIAAVVRVGGQHWLTLSAITRDSDGVPRSLGSIEQIVQLPGPSAGLAWLGDEALGVLTRDGDTQQLLELTIGGPGTVSVVPADTVGLAGANTVLGARLLSSTGVVSVKRGTTWQESTTGVLVIGTQAGR